MANAVNIVELKESILADNDRDAEKLREETLEKKTCYLNVMSSPGAGKTTTILALLRAVGSRLSCGVMEADIDSDVDARTIQAAGYPAVQLHTGGMCHLDAQMSRQGIAALMKEYSDKPAPQSDAGSASQDAAVTPQRTNTPAHPDLIILENVGNLVCPAEFDTGADLNICILSVPEGDDKPLKYPLMFTKCDAVLINKMDALPAFDFDLARCTSYIRERNKEIRIFPISARTGEGVQAAADWLVNRVQHRLHSADATEKKS